MVSGFPVMGWTRPFSQPASISSSVLPSAVVRVAEQVAAANEFEATVGGGG